MTSQQTFDELTGKAKWEREQERRRKHLAELLPVIQFTDPARYEHIRADLRAIRGEAK